MIIGLLEGLLFVAEIAWYVLDFVLTIIDLVAWARSRRNRRARRAARRRGEPRVPMDAWNKAFWILLGIVVILTTVLIVA